MARRWKYAQDDTYTQLYKKLGVRQIIRDPYDPFWRTTEENDKEKGRIMKQMLIDPMVGWASKVALDKMTPEQFRGQYMLVNNVQTQRMQDEYAEDWMSLH